MFFDLKWKNEFQKIYFIFHIWLLNWKEKNKKNCFWIYSDLKSISKNKNQNFRFHFLISNQKINFKKFFHFSTLVMKLKNEKFSKFVFFLSKKTSYTFSTWIKTVFWIYFDLKSISKNKNQNFRIHFLIPSQKINFKKFFHFSIWLWNWKMKNEKFSKFILFLNQKTSYTFGTWI